MRLVIKLFALAVVLAFGWCLIFSCLSLKGEVAPPLTGGTFVVDGMALATNSATESDWKLLAFFSPG